MAPSFSRKIALRGSYGTDVCEYITVALHYNVIMNIHSCQNVPCRPQAIRHQVLVVREGHRSHRDRAARSRQRLPPPLLLLHHLHPAAVHGRRVLPHDRQQARVQGRLRGRKGKG